MDPSSDMTSSILPGVPEAPGSEAEALAALAQIARLAGGAGAVPELMGMAAGLFGGMPRGAIGATADARAARAEMKYRSLVEQLPAITFMASFDGGIDEVYVSPQIETLLGYTQSEWLDNPVLWYERLHADDTARWNVEFARTAALGEPFKSTYRFVARNGRVVWIHGEARLVRDEHGHPLFIQGLGFDVTEMKTAEAELLRSTEELRRSNAELEQFAFLASHDLQEPLRKISSYVELIERKFKDDLDKDSRRYIHHAVDGVRRMRALIHDLLAYSRVGREPGEAVSFEGERILADVLDDLEADIAAAGTVVTHDRLPRLLGRPTELNQVLQNLIGNAIKFRGEETPRVHVGLEKRKADWLFRVSDNGIGIAPEHQEQVFEIFKRLHPRSRYDGTGIGLAICRKIVEYNGGTIWIESAPGHGTTFLFTVPLR